MGPVAVVGQTNSLHLGTDSMLSPAADANQSSIEAALPKSHLMYRQPDPSGVQKCFSSQLLSF